MTGPLIRKPENNIINLQDRKRDMESRKQQLARRAKDGITEACPYGKPGTTSANQVVDPKIPPLGETPDKAK